LIKKAFPDGKAFCCGHLLPSHDFIVGILQVIREIGRKYLFALDNPVFIQLKTIYSVQIK